ncbi:MAG: 50S ribosomal protein L24 [Armatimonadetes bacterium OLB18]|nr:MAG: 50S ribosomal protein L24 [Armatimonadetes bacterium OLB18]
MTKAETKQRKKPVKLKVRRGDRVQIIAGKDKGEVGFVAAVDPKKQRVLVLKPNDENPDQPLPLNAGIKHRKARTAEQRSTRLRIPLPIHVSNVMVLDPKSSEPTRVGRKVIDGKIQRYAKKSGEIIPDEESN